MELLYRDTVQLSDSDIEETAQSLKAYTDHLRQVAKQGGYTEPECSINVPFDKNIIADVLAAKGKVHYQNLKYILVVGIGGSNLGTKAIYDALYGSFDILEKNQYPKILFVDTTDPEFLLSLLRFLESEIASPEEIVINAVSKSGTTTETIANTIKHHSSGVR